ncbi:arylsulfotransferase family protein [Streptomyces sp. 7-21]|jgi:hypothetical protein|uniref:arylsulfotransferase family protein n=1 Tax=Streptomyces sp. 7-21 TaxID=2802283 RepID=UPI00191E24DD|nr:arylsulfotransferase family protein [Streptomyces sp. 7-21]MBL1065739.1 aryl-sulfate sulfotransferase [Streptomyces sp. 7-21]
MIRQLRGGAAVAAAAALFTALAPATSASAAAPDAGTAPSPSSAPDFHTLQGDVAELTTTPTGLEDPGLLMTTPSSLGTGMGAAAIYDNNGELVWWQEPEFGTNYMNLRQVEYEGQPALLLFRIALTGTPGDASQSEAILLDTSYNEIRTFSVQGYATDAHDLAFSPDGERVVLQSYVPVQYDLSPYGGPQNALILDSVIQEQVIDTGEITFEWSALENLPVTESQLSLSQPSFGQAFDLFHTNSLEYDTDGNLLVSARGTSTVYKLDPDTGEIIWRFGGNNSDFTFANPADMPSFQHDARRLPDGRLSVFDNGNNHVPPLSRGVSYVLDENAMTAQLVEELRPSAPLFTPYIGSNRHLPNGNQLVNFGITGQMVEFSSGSPVFTGVFEQGWSSYRAERGDWHATPATDPDAVIGETTEDGVELHMSWNGATDVASWSVAAGPGENDLTTLKTVPDAGFETTTEIAPPDGATVYQVTALGPDGQPLGSTTITL